MKMSLMLLFLFLAIACGPTDSRSSLEHARDDVTACEGLGGTPIIKEYALGYYVTCPFLESQ